ncbi:hypothetical protein [Bradyrhizobium sp. NAS80.1]|uniref:hypothetical protein n=1 Tax=Bradyrhizobium sp. NAS80.1 TaxID=1680159 RepID=UPI001161298A|nr:hypothetical protein [Bradyrhizobium sp. NAS80.1]
MDRTAEADPAENGQSQPQEQTDGEEISQGRRFQLAERRCSDSRFFVAAPPGYAEELSSIYLDEADKAVDPSRLELAQQLAARSIARLADLRSIASLPG